MKIHSLLLCWLCLIQYSLAGLPNLPTIQDIAAEQDSDSSVRIIEQPSRFRKFQQPTPPLIPTIPAFVEESRSERKFSGNGPLLVVPPAILPAASEDSLLMPQVGNVKMPQVVSLDVSCSKESMIVSIRFDQIFNGLIYSKGFYNNKACRYVPFNSGKDFYSFKILLNSCGSQFVDQETSGNEAAYLENVIVIQNEEGIQEMWDTTRRIRCLWEVLSEKKVTYSFGVDLPETPLAAFRTTDDELTNLIMDLQIGKGPAAPRMNRIVKIGETLTVVISTDRETSLDIHVKDCVAHDGSRNNPVVLTDGQGCVLKKKLMGPWQKTRQNGAVLAYSFFQAFKFPDTLDIFLECNVEMCKQQCDICPSDPVESRIRSRRALDSGSRTSNSTAGTSSDIRIGRRLRVLSPDDISYNEDTPLATVTLTNGKTRAAKDDVCMSITSFVVGLVVILLVLVISCVMTALLCIKVRSMPGIESTYAPSSFHAFSSSASKS